MSVVLVAIKAIAIAIAIAIAVAASASAVVEAIDAGENTKKVYKTVNTD